MHSKFSWSRNDVGSSRSTCFINFFHMGAIFRIFPDILMSCTCTDKNNPYFRLTNRHTHPSSINASSNCLSHKSPASGYPYKFLSRGTTGSSMLFHELGHHLCRGKRIHVSGHSDVRSFNNSEATSILTWV